MDRPRRRKTDALEVLDHAVDYCYNTAFEGRELGVLTASVTILLKAFDEVQKEIRDENKIYDAERKRIRN